MSTPVASGTVFATPACCAATPPGPPTSSWSGNPSAAGGSAYTDHAARTEDHMVCPRANPDPLPMRLKKAFYTCDRPRPPSDTGANTSLRLFTARLWQYHPQPMQGNTVRTERWIAAVAVSFVALLALSGGCTSLYEPLRQPTNTTRAALAAEPY